MSSLKSLMKARKASARLQHPHARYSPAGQLSCALCGLPLKADSLWGSHLVSKQHRVNVQRWEAEQAAAAATGSSGKRKRDDVDSDSGAEEAGKRPRDEQDGHDAGGLPADFFADPSQAPAPRAASSEPTGQPPGQGQAEDDPDWAAFEAYLASAPAPSLPASSVAGAPPSRSTATATISAAPVAYEFGAPKVAQAGEEGEGEEEEEQGETEEERVEREMREEREEMMARLEEEEREQKEADEKVTVLKRRLEAIRAARKKKAQA
ncbi:hypothetical protein JCM21900_002045 [Sporobolomyces salmonicolor]